MTTFTIDLQIDVGGFLERKWRHVAPKSHQNPAYAENLKNAFGVSPLVPNWVRGIQQWIKNRTKIDLKMKSTLEGILASIFDRFWWTGGAKLGSKIDKKSIQKGVEKRWKNEAQQDGQKVAIKSYEVSGWRGSRPLGRIRESKEPKNPRIRGSENPRIQ